MDVLQVVMSVPYTTPWVDPLPVRDAAAVEMRLIKRRVDWQVTRRRRLYGAARDAYRLFRASGSADAVVVCTAMVDALMAAALFRLRPRVAVVVWDFLLPSHPLVRRAARIVLRRVDRWLVIRRGDEETFRRDLGARHCAFTPFPCEPLEAASETAERRVYAGGLAHRDWPTLVEAARLVDGDFVICTSDAVEVPLELSGRFRVLPALSPPLAREEMSKATVVCVPFVVTDLPCGPLVVLDALAAGKALVTSDVNGTRDYVRDGVTGRLVPAGDSPALAQALTELLDCPSLRHQLGGAGRAFCRETLTLTAALRRIETETATAVRVRRSAQPSARFRTGGDTDPKVGLFEPDRAP